MKKINSLSDLLLEELADLLNAEDQLAEVLPKMVQDSQSTALKVALEDNLKVSKTHVHRLKDIFSNIGQNPQGGICEDMKGFISESYDVLNKMNKSQTRDAAIISVAQRMEQYVISRYKMARGHAADLGHTRITEVLTDTLNEERVMNLHLNELAQYMISVQAVNSFDSRQSQRSSQQKDPSAKPMNGGFYISKGKFGRRGIKKKSKSTEVSRFISEGNPNIQEPEEKGKEIEKQDL